MITVKLYRNGSGDVYAFDTDNHGVDFVCSAVSILVLNTVNSIEAFTDGDFACDFDEQGGHFSFALTNAEHPPHDVRLLLNTMVLGLEGIMSEYGDQLRIMEYRN